MQYTLRFLSIVLLTLVAFCFVRAQNRSVNDVIDPLEMQREPVQLPPAVHPPFQPFGAALIYDNGPYVTHPGGGPNGTHGSVLQNSTFGMTILGFGVTGTNRLADDFVVPPSVQWRIDSITVNAYTTNADTTVPPSATAINFRIWSGPPDSAGSSVVFGDTTTNRLLSTYWRREVRYTQTTVNVSRAIKIVNASAGVTLPPGRYWLDWNITGLNYAPPITITGDTVTGNARQRLTSGWVNLLDGTKPQGMPFQLHGQVLGGTDTLLVILHDSTVGTSTLKRKADRDTLLTYLPGLVSNYRLVFIDSSAATLPNLSNYNKILIQETSFDAAVVRWIGVNGRQAIKNWLNGGTPSNRRKFIMIGADLGWTYSRSGSGGRDTTLAHQLLKFTYIMDNAATSQNSITGVTVNAGQVFAYSTNPPGGGFYPDGCSPGKGSDVLYMYTGGSATDTVAGVGYAAPGYIAASLFQDPRYFTGTFGSVLRSLLQYTGILLTNVEEQKGEVPSEFALLQNYPNPFNPTTTITYKLSAPASVNLKVYNVLGQEVATLMEGQQNIGTFQTVWDGRNSAGSPVGSGVYFYTLSAKPLSGGNTFISTKKMVLLK